MSVTDEDWFDEVFADPDRVGEAEYRAIYNVVQEHADHPELVAATLREFGEWATTLLADMWNHGLLQKGVKHE